MNIVQKLIHAVLENRKRIVIIGDALTDVWVHGRVEPCQDGCEKFVQERYIEKPGGAWNAQRSLTNWPIDVDLFSFEGNDNGVKMRFIDGDGRIVFRYDSDVIADVELRKRYWMTYKLMLEMVGCASAVLISDYDKGFLTPDYISTVIAACAERGVPCVADAKRAPDVYAGTIIKGNEEYWKKYDHVGRGSVAGSVKTRGYICPVVQLGSNRQAVGVYEPFVDEVNHVGAGDCFAAHLTLALAYELTLTEAAAVAHSAGRVYVQHPHNRPPTPGEIVLDDGVPIALSTS